MEDTTANDSALLRTSLRKTVGDNSQQSGTLERILMSGGDSGSQSTVARFEDGSGEVVMIKRREYFWIQAKSFVLEWPCEF